MKITVLVSLLLSTSLNASVSVINPVESLLDKAVVFLEGIQGDCTGSVVGLNPVTVITAKHCIAASAAYLDRTRPKTIVIKSFKDEVFKAFEGVLPGDIAVVIYGEPQEHFPSLKNLTKRDLFKLNSSPIRDGQKIEFCGFGGTLPQMAFIEAGNFHCGVNTMILENPADNHIADFPKDTDEKLDQYSPKDQKKYLLSYVQNELITYGAGTRIGIVNIPGEKKESLVHMGDSGGPMFIRDEEGQKFLVAVSSAAAAATFNGVVRPYTGFGWRIDSDWTKEFLQEARDKGADL